MYWEFDVINKVYLSFNRKTSHYRFNIYWEVIHMLRYSFPRVVRYNFFYFLVVVPNFSAQQDKILPADSLFKRRDLRPLIFHEFNHMKYYGGLKFVPLGCKRLLILQSVNKVKLNLTSCFTRVRFAKKEHDEKFNFTLSTSCRMNNLLNPRGTNFSPPYYFLYCSVLFIKRLSKFRSWNFFRVFKCVHWRSCIVLGEKKCQRCTTLYPEQCCDYLDQKMQVSVCFHFGRRYKKLDSFSDQTVNTFLARWKILKDVESENFKSSWFMH